MKRFGFRREPAIWVAALVAVAQGVAILVTGDPTTDITATRAIAGVWKGGHAIDRAAYAAQVTAETSRALPCGRLPSR